MPRIAAIHVKSSFLFPPYCTTICTVPDVVRDESDMLRYIAPSGSSSFSLAIPAHRGVSEAEWHLNGAALSDANPGFSISPFPTVSLTLRSFEPARHVGRLELVLGTDLGPITVAVWELRESGG